AHLHQRDPRSSSSLFDGYDRPTPSRSPAARRDNLRSAAPAAWDTANHSPAFGAGSGYGNHAFGAYPNSADLAPASGGYRAATPNSRGQYSDAVLSSLESQNDEDIEGISARVKMLKNVGPPHSLTSCVPPSNALHSQVTLAIGDEIRDSTALAEKMNETFDSTRVKLRGTMNRMLRMAEKTGVGWKVWLLFFAAVIGLFWYVWLF
ncbi:protein transport protein bet1, partial [Ascosphaera pollenicola]